MSAIWAGPLSRLAGVSTVTVHRDGVPFRYRAVVFEEVAVGPGVEEHRDCASRYWRAFFWSEADHPDGLVLMGGQFGRRLRPWMLICSVFRLARPEPMLVAFVSDSDRTLNDPIAKDGEADISRGAVIGECAFLAADDARHLREAWGISKCELTRHRVRFKAEFGRPSGKVSSEWVESRAELPPADVIGIRYTIECDGTGRWGCPKKAVADTSG